MWVIDLVTFLVTWLTVGFGVVLIGYRYRGWKGDLEETELTLVAMIAWPLMVIVWLLKIFGAGVKRFGRLAATAGRCCCKDD